MAARRPLFLAVSAVLLILSASSAAAESGPALSLDVDTQPAVESSAPEHAHLQTLSQEKGEKKETPSYASCVSLCTSQKRALHKQVLAQQAAEAQRKKDLKIQQLLAKKRAIVAQLKKMGITNHMVKGKSGSSRRLMSADNTEDDEKRAHRLATYATTDATPEEASKIKRLLQERKRLLAYLHPKKATQKSLDQFEARLKLLPFQVTATTDCMTQCKAVKSGGAKKAKTQMKPYAYSQGDCDSGVMIMPPDFPVRVVNKGDCATCSMVCSSLKFTSPWIRDERGSCSVRAEGDMLDRQLRNFHDRVTLNLCTPLKGYDGFQGSTPTLNGFNGDAGYVGAPAFTKFEEAHSGSGCCGNDIDLYAGSCETYTACECECCIYVYCNDNPYTWRY